MSCTSLFRHVAHAAPTQTAGRIRYIIDSVTALLFLPPFPYGGGGIGLIDMPRRTADEFSEGGIPFNYLSDEAKENAIENVGNDDGLYDVASMTIDEHLDSMKV